MPTPCFMVEAFNERTRHVDCSNEPRCCDGWEETQFDVRRVDNGEVLQTDVGWMSEKGLPPGAMFWTTITQDNRPTGPDDWDHEGIAKPENQPDAKRSPSHTFADGPHLCVILPNGNRWEIDSRASNCGSPYDYAHRCWVRHGEPPRITVDKNGPTCQAGAGSISSGSYHGFLRDGVLTDG